MSDKVILIEAAKVETACPDCGDFDEDCADILDKVNCYVYAPERGMCPYLRAAAALAGDTGAES